MAINQSPEAAINAKPKPSDGFLTSLTDGLHEFGGAFRDAYSSIPMPHAKFAEFQHESPGVDHEGLNFHEADKAMALAGKNLYGSFAPQQPNAEGADTKLNDFLAGKDVRFLQEAA